MDRLTSPQNRTPPTPIEVVLSEQLKAMDPAILGQRLKHARRRSGLNQTKTANGIITASYLSRMEAGERRPDITALHALAERLGTTAEEILSSNPTHPVLAETTYNRLVSELDYAEMALNTGSTGESITKARSICTELDDLLEQRAAVNHNFLHKARHLLGKALETGNEPEEALTVLEPLTIQIDPDLNPTLLLTVYIALTRINRDLGRYDRSILVGLEGQDSVSTANLYGLDQGLMLIATTASAYYENNQPDQAIRICVKALEAAKTLGTPLALGAICWNTSTMYQREGNAEAALPLAVQALDFLDRSREAKHQVRMRGQLAAIQLAVIPPQVDEAIANLEQVLTHLDFIDAKPGDWAAPLLFMARAQMLNGALDAALDYVDRAEKVLGEDTPLWKVTIASTRGRVATVRGEMDLAQGYFRQAVMGFSSLGSDRSAARLWYELADYLREAGMIEEAVSAYQSAGVASGLRLAPNSRLNDWTIPADLSND